MAPAAVLGLADQAAVELRVLLARAAQQTLAVAAGQAWPVTVGLAEAA